HWSLVRREEPLAVAAERIDRIIAIGVETIRCAALHPREFVEWKINAVGTVEVGAIAERPVKTDCQRRDRRIVRCNKIQFRRLIQTLYVGGASRDAAVIKSSKHYAGVDVEIFVLALIVLKRPGERREKQPTFGNIVERPYR